MVFSSILCINCRYFDFYFMFSERILKYFKYLRPESLLEIKLRIFPVDQETIERLCLKSQQMQQCIFHHPNFALAKWETHKFIVVSSYDCL